VEPRLKWIDKAHSAERGPRVKILAEDGSQAVHFGDGPQLGIPEIELVVTNGASRRQDHFGGHLENGPDLRVALQFEQCCFARQRRAQADRRYTEELREYLRAYGTSAMLFEGAKVAMACCCLRGVEMSYR
jgi:hypothetical protein